MIRTTLIIITALLITQQSVLSQEEEIKDLPVYQGKDLKIDPFRLRPNRSQAWPRSATMSAIFNNPQVSYSVERGDYYGPGEIPRKGIRIRWVANTHSFEDAAYVDAETFAIIKQTGTIGGVKHEKFSHSYFGKGKVVRTILRNDSLPASTEFKLKYRDYYHLIVMPYLFASSDLPAGEKFYLPFYSVVRNQESLIKVEIVGNTTYEDSFGQKKTAWRVDTDHGYAKLEWYLDKANPPYLLGTRWQAYAGGKLVSDNKGYITKWIEFEGDDFDQIIIRK